MLDFLPAFDFSMVERMERNAQENATRAAIYRRVAFALLTKTSAELRAAVSETEAAEAFLSNTEGLRGAIEWHEARSSCCARPRRVSWQRYRIRSPRRVKKVSPTRRL
jgi:hypothetical protein